MAVRPISSVKGNGLSVDQAMQQQAIAQALQQRASQPNIPANGGPVQAQYGPGNALVDLANSLAASWNLKQANNKVQQAQDSDSEMRASALANYQKSVPDDQVGAESLKAITASPQNELPQTVTSRSDATRDLTKAFGPQMQSQVAAALLQRDMGQKPAEPYTLSPDARRYDASNREVAANPKAPKVTEPKPMQHTSEGLMFDPNKNHYLDPDGNVLNAKQVQEWRTKMAADRTAATTTARNDAQKVGDIPPDTLELLATDYRKTSKLPPLFRDNESKWKIMNRAAAQAKEAGDDATAAVIGRQTFGANKKAMDKVTAQKNMVGSFEKTFQKNLDLALQLSEKVDRTGSPMINRGLQHWKTHVISDPETKGFVNALTTAKDEYAKILSGATGAAGITDSARAESDKLFSTVDSKETLAYVAQIARQEAGNRMSSFDEQLADINKAMGGAEDRGPQVGAIEGGYRFKGGNPADKNSWEKQ